MHNSGDEAEPDGGTAGDLAASQASGLSRRGFLARAGSAVMGAGLLAGYGTFAAYALLYLYPAHPREQDWLLVAPLAQLPKGAALAFVAPDGQKIAIARQGEGESAQDFVALGSTCPHLGCQVRWEGQNNRFFCPCHNGEFDKTGKGIGGPPGKAGQSLPRFPLKVEYGILYIQVPLDSLPRPV